MVLGLDEVGREVVLGLELDEVGWKVVLELVDRRVDRGAGAGA